MLAFFTLITSQSNFRREIINMRNEKKKTQVEKTCLSSGTGIPNM
jgi:hypothetical protein